MLLGDTVKCGSFLPSATDNDVPLECLTALPSLESTPEFQADAWGSQLRNPPIKRKAPSPDCLLLTLRIHLITGKATPEVRLLWTTRNNRSTRQGRADLSV